MSWGWIVAGVLALIIIAMLVYYVKGMWDITFRG